MMSFSKDTDFARSTPAKIASYLVSLLDAGKPNNMTCSILSPVRALSYKLTPAPVWREASSTLRIHRPVLSRSIFDWDSSGRISTNTCPFNAKRGLY